MPLEILRRMKMCWWRKNTCENRIALGHGNLMEITRWLNREYCWYLKTSALSHLTRIESLSSAAHWYKTVFSTTRGLFEFTSLSLDNRIFQLLECLKNGGDSGQLYFLMICLSFFTNVQISFLFQSNGGLEI